VTGPGQCRVLVAFETLWDRKQLEASGAAAGGRLELAFPAPDDASCPWDFDALGWLEDAVAGRLGRVDAVLSSSDYPGATLAAAIATRLGLPGPRPERVIEASHKYLSRLAQRRAAPEAVPRFALLDPRTPQAPPPLGFPCFVKPVKGSFSVLARRIGSAPELAAFLASDGVRRFTEEYLAIFNRLVAALTAFEVDGRFFLAEECLRGQQVTLEGFVCDGEVEVLGVVDSGLHPGGSFARFDYPSALPAAVQERMAELARRVVRELGLERTLFNLELAFDPAADRIAVIEVNPRLCGQFADLYQKVDGTSGYEVALALALGERPRPARRAGAFAAAASFPLRVFEPVRVGRAPDAAALRDAEALFPGTLIWSECAAGDELADFERYEDGASHRYAVVNLGGADRGDLERRLAVVCARLDYRMDRLRPR
jgi:biotin carboxylase